MEGWAGFTDEDLRKFKGDGPKKTRPTRQDRKCSQGNTKRNRQQGKLATAGSDRSSQPAYIPSEQMLSKPNLDRPTVTPQFPTDDTRTNESDKVISALPDMKDVQTIPVQSNGADAQPSSLDEIVSTQTEKMPEIEMVTDEVEILSREMNSLHKFQDQQKMIEELNKKKKLILATAIQQRQKKAKVEAAKLSAIQTELGKLDQMVNVDVAIIRNRIESTSRDFLEAQKRYDRAEKEFISSKIDFYEKQELKESLTEHLYAVIHQNEMRKAKKLAELMEKLEMEGAEDIDELRDFSFPNLTILNQTQTSHSHSHAPQPTSPSAELPAKPPEGAETTVIPPSQADKNTVEGSVLEQHCTPRAVTNNHKQTVAEGAVDDKRPSTVNDSMINPETSSSQSTADGTTNNATKLQAASELETNLNNNL